MQKKVCPIGRGRGVSSVVRAGACRALGHWFNSSTSLNTDFFFTPQPMDSSSAQVQIIIIVIIIVVAVNHNHKKNKKTMAAMDFLLDMFKLKCEHITKIRQMIDERRERFCDGEQSFLGISKIGMSAFSYALMGVDPSMGDRNKLIALLNIVLAIMLPHEFEVLICYNNVVLPPNEQVDFLCYGSDKMCALVRLIETRWTYGLRLVLWYAPPCFERNSLEAFCYSYQVSMPRGSVMDEFLSRGYRKTHYNDDELGYANEPRCEASYNTKLYDILRNDNNLSPLVTSEIMKFVGVREPMMVVALRHKRARILTRHTYLGPILDRRWKEFHNANARKRKRNTEQKKQQPRQQQKQKCAS